MIKALIFDFDGLIVDTEGPIFEVWQRIYRERGQQLPRERWLTIIGTASGSFDPVLDLGERLGQRLNKDEFDRLERLYYQEATVAQRLLPGVGHYLEEARRLGLKTAIASSSHREWVMDHMARLAIDHEFDTIVTREDVSATKPDPSLYRVALERLQVAPAEAIALEDSSNGIRAAKAAGIVCIVVPNPMTAEMDLTWADLRVESLGSLPLTELIRRVEQMNGERAQR